MDDTNLPHWPDRNRKRHRILPVLQNRTSRLRVLVSAYACAPNIGTEQGVGWDCVNALAEHHDLWVITKRDAQADIESYLASSPMPSVRFIYYELPEFLRPFGFGDPKKPTQLYYYLWQLGILRLAEKIIMNENIDIIHHITFVKFWAPSFISKLPRPFVWGPVGGGETAPASFTTSFSRRGKIYEFLRDLARRVAERDPFVRETARNAAVTLATTDETADRVRTINDNRPVTVYPAIGLTNAELALYGTRPARSGTRTRFVSIGRLLHWKGFHLALEAFSRVDAPDVEYRIIGSGPELDRLRALVDELGIAERIAFTGNIARQDVLRQLAECDVLVHPSLHESGGGVVLEAMAARLPVIALDLGGPAQHLADGAGILVGADTPRQSVQSLAGAMSKLAGNPDLRRTIGERGHARLLERYLWPQKAAYYSSLYSSLIVGDALSDVTIQDR